MIRTNLSTRPFYNERAVHLWLLVVALVVAAATVLNVTTGLRYRQGDNASARQADADEARTVELRQQVIKLRSSLDPRAAVTIADRISAAPALLDMLTPLVGLLLRDRKAAMVPA